ncbi:hypothetical protein [Rhodococcoides yunnanense]|nr:hypothetical protein [Rhodococcus yunnanensis]
MTYLSTTVGVTAAFDSVASYQGRTWAQIFGAPPARGLSEADRRRTRGE